MSEIQKDKTQPSGFARALNSMMDNLENVVGAFQRTLLVMLEKIEKLESLEKSSRGDTAPNEKGADIKEIKQLANDATTSAETPTRALIWGAEMKQKFSYSKIRFVLGLASLIMGLLAANLALFQWVERTGLNYLFGGYARYVCACGGFAAMIFGAMLVNDFLVLTKILKGIRVADNGGTMFSEVEKEEEKKRVVGKGHKNRRQKIVAISLAIFLFMLCPMVVSSIVSYTATVVITPYEVETLDLYVGSFDATKDQWAKAGSSPYLHAQDEPNNNVYSPFEGIGSKHGDLIGDFGFEDANQTGTIISVKLRVHGHASTSNPDKCYFSVWLWDGSSWINTMDMKGEGSYLWKEVDVSSYLDNWDKINGAKIYLRTEDTDGVERGEHACDAALIRVNHP